MSKGTMAKTKTEKGGKGSNVPTPAVAHEIVTGKFTDQDWLLMLDRDDGDEFITDIIEDLSSQVMDNIFVEYISRQLIPYTVLQAREAMVQIIQWQFLTTDKGETNIMEDPGWIADEEPIPATTDSWAQGAVPKLHMILSPLGEILEQADEPSEPQSSDELPEKLEMKEGQDDDEAEEAVEEAVEEATTAATDMDSLAAEESSVIREDPCIEIFQQDLTGEPRPSVPKKKPKKKFKPYTGIISSDSLSKILEPLERTEMEMLVRDLPLELVPSPEPGLLTMPASCQSLIKLQAGRPPGLKDVVYDEQGNVTAVARIELHKVPSRRYQCDTCGKGFSIRLHYHDHMAAHTGVKRYVCSVCLKEFTAKHTLKIQMLHLHPAESAHVVKTGFEIIDPMVEESQARLEAMRTGRYMGTLRPHPPPLPEAKKKSSRRYTLGTAKLGTALQIAAFSNMSKVKGSITPLPPPLIECMEVAPGVIVREGDRVKRGPKQRPKKQPGIFAMVKDLRPIAGKTLATSLTVSDLLDTSPPTVRSIPVAPSIPPIATHAT